MKKIKFLTLMLVGLLVVSLSSCSSDDGATQDPRDQYVGTWSFNETGSVTLFQNGQSIGTGPINESGTVVISKSGENALSIRGTNFIVNGTNLSSNPENFSDTTDGINIVGTATYSGTLGSNLITINNSIVGTWNTSGNLSGNLSGTSVTTLTR
jgi:hypothetical protein